MTTRHALVAFLLTTALGAGAPFASAQGSSQLTTTPSRPFTTAAGVAFDVSATTQLSLHRVAVGASSRSGLARSIETVEVWTRPGGTGVSAGTQFPFDQNPAGWTRAGVADVEFNSSRGIVEIPVDLNLRLAARETVGIVVYSPSFGNAFRTENPPIGSTIFSDVNLILESRENVLYTEQVALFGTVSSLTYYSRRDPINVLGRVSYDVGLTRTTPVNVTTSELPEGTRGIVYAWNVRATGGAAPYTYNATGLPAGLRLDTNTGQIAGIPLLAGLSTVVFTVTDSAGQIGSRPLNMDVAAGPPAATGRLTIDTAQNLPNAIDGTAYSQTLAASGASGTVSWRAATPTPPWLRVDANTGELSGNPGVYHTGAFTLAITATDSAGSVTKTFQLEVKKSTRGTPLRLTTLEVPAGTAGVSYRTNFVATGGVGPYTFQLGGFPRGLAFDSSTATLQGSPPAAGEFSLQLVVRDSAGTEAYRAYWFEVDPPVASPLTVATPSPLPDGTEGQAYRQLLAANGGTGNYSWRGSGLPRWLGLSSTGELTGTPGANDVGATRFTVTVSDGVTSANATLDLTVAATIPPLQIANTVLPSGTAGQVYAGRLLATGGTGGHTWAATGLPTELRLDTQNGLITGTPTVAGTFLVDVAVVDSAQVRVTAQLSLLIVPGVGGGTSGSSGTVATRGGGGSGGCALSPDAPASPISLALLALALLAARLSVGRRTPTVLRSVS